MKPFEGPRSPFPPRTEDGEYEYEFGGEIVTPTAVLVDDPKNADGTVSGAASWERGWLAAMTRAFRKDGTVEERKKNVEEIVDAAKKAGVPKDKIWAHLESIGIRVHD